jgi:hypothetical protein
MTADALTFVVVNGRRSAMPWGKYPTHEDEPAVLQGGICDTCVTIL